MDSGIRAQRHQQLWEAGNASVRRITIGGLIFAVLVLIKVIAPYGKKEVLETKLLSVQEKATLMAANLDRIKSVEQQLIEIEQIIRSNQLEKAKIELENFFKAGSRGDAQERANQTLNQIEIQINALVVEPLSKTIEEQNIDGELAELPKVVEAAIKQWISGKLNTKWYINLKGKEEAFKQVQVMLNEFSNKATEIITDTRQQVDKDKQALETSFIAQEKDVDELKGSIESAMSEALPSWAGKLISAATMVMIYPWILIALALYLFGSAVNAARHYRGMADEKGWTIEERSDPLMSSIWTLTSRGTIGTITTQIMYAAVLLSLWYCFYLSQQYTQVAFITNILEQSQNQSSADQQIIPIWFGHGLMLLVVIAALIIPWRRKT